MNGRPPPKVLLCGLLLGICGFLANLFGLELFLDVDFLSGSFFVMLAIMRFGGVCGVIAGFIAGTCTYFLWNHPWNIIIMTAEAAFVAWLFQTRLRNLLLCDILYWLLLGSPMVYLFFHQVMGLQLHSTALIMLKQPINGIFNALLATIVSSIMQTRMRKRPQLVPFRDLIFMLMASIILFPALIFLVLNLRAELKQETLTLAGRVSYRCEVARENLTLWINEHHQNVQTLARLIGDPGVTPVPQIQRILEMIKTASPAFVRMGVMNRRGISIAYSPLEDEAGVSTLGIDFSDRRYVAVMKETKQPYVSDVVMARVKPATPALPLVAPTFSGKEYSGFCCGVIDLSRINRMLAVLSGGNQVQITVLDRNHKVVASSRAGLNAMEEYHRPPGSIEPVGRTDVNRWIPETRAGTPYMERWRKSLLFKEQAVSPGLGWVVIVESSMLPAVKFLTQRSIQSLSILSLLIALTAVLAYLAGQRSTCRLRKLQEVTTNLPSHLSDVSGINWPDSKISEVNQLSGNFRQMVSALAVSFHEQNMLNESLESRIIERTEALNLANERLNEAQRISGIGSCDIDLLTGALACSDGVYRIYEIDPGTVTASHELFQQAVHPEDRAMVRHAYESRTQNRTAFDIVYRLLMPEGRVKHIHEISETVFAEDGAPQRCLVTVQDITARKYAEEALRQSEERFLKAFHASPAPLMITRFAVGYVFDVNESLLHQFAFRPDEVLSHRISELPFYLNPEDRAQLLELLRDQGQVREYGMKLQTKSGDVREVLLSAEVVEIQGEECVLTSPIDITERKRAEEERLQLEQRLQQAQKAESLGRMAGAIAHNFNNLLGVVMGNLELVLNDLYKESELRTNIADAMTASKRAAEISQFMLTYVGQTAGKREPLDLAEATREVCLLLNTSLPRQVHLETELPPRGPIILANGAHIKQVLTNLALNTGEAIGEEKGDIKLAVRVTESAEILESDLFPSDWEPKAESYACLSVSDTGCGLDAATLQKIFDPFFSTKFTGRGLGLAVVLGLVRGLEGAIAVESQLGRGTTFRVFFPMPELETRPSPEQEPLISGSPETGGLVLVVEDEPMLRKLAQTLLKQLGHEVITAHDGYEAVKVFRERKDEFRLVLLDLSMPRMNGWQTLAALRTLRSDIPVVLSSGYDEAQVMQGYHQELPQAFLHKPYRVADLKAAFGEALKVPVAANKGAE